MANTGTDYEVWTGLTASVNSNISGISDMSELVFSATTMTPFTSFNESIVSFNAAISSLKAFTTTDVSNMNQAAANKVEDDEKQAKGG